MKVEEEEEERGLLYRRIWHREIGSRALVLWSGPVKRCQLVSVDQTIVSCRDKVTTSTKTDRKFRIQPTQLVSECCSILVASLFCVHC